VARRRQLDREAVHLGLRSARKGGHRALPRREGGRRQRERHRQVAIDAETADGHGQRLPQNRLRRDIRGVLVCLGERRRVRCEVALAIADNQKKADIVTKTLGCSRCPASLCHHVAIAYAKHGLPDPLWNPNMSREDALDDASARKAALARLFQKPAAALTEPVKMQPSVPDSAGLVAIARAGKLQRAEKADSIRMKRLHR
jgi:hypothetical protein